LPSGQSSKLPPSSLGIVKAISSIPETNSLTEWPSASPY
jgi:hypothetical protein